MKILGIAGSLRKASGLPGDHERGDEHGRRGAGGRMTAKRNIKKAKAIREEKPRSPSLR